jgi:GTP1/Obg family GTP-binding protein
MLQSNPTIEQMKNAMRDQLEAIVDHIGLAQTLVNLADIANLKAEHIRANWQDNLTACDWERDAKRLERFAKGLIN